MAFGDGLVSDAFRHDKERTLPFEGVNKINIYMSVPSSNEAYEAIRSVIGIGRARLSDDAYTLNAFLEDLEEYNNRVHKTNGE